MEFIKQSVQNTGKTDFSIENLLRKSPINTRKNIEVNDEELVVDSIGDEDDLVNVNSYCTQSNYDSEDQSIPSSPEINSIKDNSTYIGLNEEDLHNFSWLSCTRFKPPKLPRSKKRAGCKRYGRGPRIPFAPHQIAVLERTFSKSQYLSSDCIHSLADTLHLSETRVKIWFQNRRARYRREKEASSMIQRNINIDHEIPLPQFYTTHHIQPHSFNTNIPNISSIQDESQHPSETNTNLINRNQVDYNRSISSTNTIMGGSSSLIGHEDIHKRNSSMGAGFPDLISQQLHQYRQVQNYLLHHQFNRTYNTHPMDLQIKSHQQHHSATPPSSSSSSNNPKNSTSILHSVLQSPVLTITKEGVEGDNNHKLITNRLFQFSNNQQYTTNSTIPSSSSPIFHKHYP